MYFHDTIIFMQEKIYDIAIIGTGPAGLTLCAEISKSGKRIALIESGTYRRQEHTESLKKVLSDGEISIRPGSRERIVGGTSTTWAGLSAPMDKVDIETWPIEYAELKQYYTKLNTYGFPKLSDFDHSTLDNLRKNADFSLESNVLEEKIFIAKDPPWNFANELKDVLDKSNVTLFHDSTVIHLSSKKSPTGKQTVNGLVIKNSNGKENTLIAKTIILSAGGIENARLLLLSRDTQSSGLGNEYDQVGRYITNHPKNSYGIIRLYKPAHNLNHLFGYLHSGWAKSAGVRIREDMQKSLGILNSYVRMEPIFPWTDSKGVTDLITITKKFKLFLQWWKRFQKKLIGLRDWTETGDDVQRKSSFSWSSAFLSIVKDMPSVASYIFHRLAHSKKIPVHTIRLRNFMDMESRRENRITLSDMMDGNGKAIPVVTLNISERDRRSVTELHRLIGVELQRKNIGVLESNLDKVNPWPINTEASHHIGGTIMGMEPKTSVVDSNLKVHSVDNLYICSSSVFPTSGCANPTYTICALAIRLANHLNNV